MAHNVNTAMNCYKLVDKRQSSLNYKEFISNHEGKGNAERRGSNKGTPKCRPQRATIRRRRSPRGDKANPMDGRGY